MIDAVVPPLIAQLCDLLCNPVFSAQLASAVQGAKNKNLFLKIEASLTTSERVASQNGSLHLVCPHTFFVHALSDFIGHYRPR
jgi:hypothetical protein